MCYRPLAHSVSPALAPGLVLGATPINLPSSSLRHKFTTKLTMYGTIPDVVISKQPRNNQFRVVVALCVGVLIGALGTAMLFPVATKLTPAPTPAPRPVLAATDSDNRDDILSECRMACSYDYCLRLLNAAPKGCL